MKAVLERKTGMLLCMVLVVCVCIGGISCANAPVSVDEAKVVAADPVVPAGDQAQAGVQLETKATSGSVGGVGNLKDKSLQIVSYRLRGVGPDGSKFGWIDMEGTTFSLVGIRRGSWTLYAQALNDRGEVVASGKIDTFLSEDSPLDEIDMNVFPGVGSIKAGIVWNPSQVQDPSVEIYLKRVGGQFMSRDVQAEVSGNPGTLSWEVGAIEAGSYVARVLLKDAGRVVSGTAAAVRVIDNMTSVGTVEMTVGDLSTSYTINLNQSIGDHANGSLIEEADKVVVFHGADQERTYKLEWYVNGVGAVGDGNRLDLKKLELADGMYRVDAIVSTEQGGSETTESLIVEIL